MQVVIVHDVLGGGGGRRGELFQLLPTPPALPLVSVSVSGVYPLVTSNDDEQKTASELIESSERVVGDFPKNNRRGNTKRRSIM